ncbi:DEAD/DEAH box helicase [Tardiphaga sp. 37S4]|uniref:DEAD/DEAH box helicase n=1 Tax=Tardiphaga TaxID=1395974 RepID=UPI001E48FE7E|nr:MULTISPECIES: DEAD/DEAH box helicase [Tardiphaga]MDR6660701.1 ATP-dependent RNA helicase DeaD [Tardiphaga robiniae]UFS77741.1 DEAD/DEAH box helicase [Tardiphaga sp. 37S4]
MSFLSTGPSLARALAERNYNESTPVQAAVLADDAVGRDLLVSAQTGSGKTVAYGLAIAENLLEGAEKLPKAGSPLALIVAPTRELALQVHGELTWLYQYAGARVVSCVGGMDPRKEQRELAAGAHIVVGTPGRLCDHLRRNRLDVSELKAVVLDEADEMLDMGFREDMEFILKTTPASRRTLLFSATLPRGIANLAKQYQQQAFRVEVAGTEGGHSDIEYRAIRISPNDVEHAVVNVLRYFESPSSIVFCNTRNAVNHLQTVLLERGFSVVALSGELSQNERTHALQALRDGRARVCVATDVAARGIDLPNLGLVIHSDLPNDPEVMQHRSGRTGRAGRKGVSVLLVPPSRRRRAEMLLNLAGTDAVWGSAPTVEEIRVLDQQRMLQDTLFTEESTEDDLTLARAMLAERSAEEIAAALARLYRSRLPSPEDVQDPGTFRGREDRPGSRRRDEEGAPVRKTPKKSEPMGEGAKWFRVAIGRQKNAEARWLLPMICRRGGIEKADIGAIKIYDGNSEFEISAAAAEKFATMIKRPDKEDNIHIEPLANGPEGAVASNRTAPEDRDYSNKRPRKPSFRSDGDRPDFKDKGAYKEKSWKDKPKSDKPYQGDKPRYEGKPRFDDKPKYEGKPKFDGKPKYDPVRADKPAYAKPRSEDTRYEGKPKFDKKPRADKPPYVAKAKRDGGAPAAKPAFGKKKKIWGNAG